MPMPAPVVQVVTEDGYQLDTRSRILQAALEVFSTRGYDAATIREITNRVGVSHGLIKYHFKNKETLWQEAVRFTFERVERRLQLTEEERATLSPKEQTEREIRKAVAYYGQHPEHVRILMHEILADGDRLQWIADNFLKNLVHDAMDRNKEHADAGAFVSADPLHLYYAISGATKMIFAMAPELRRVLGFDPTTPEAIHAHADLLVKLFVQGSDKS